MSTTITLPSSDCTKFCRFCLSEINLLNVIGSSAAEQESHGELLRLVKTYLKLELQPGIDFPSAVCEMCIALLHDFDTLYHNVHDYRYAMRMLQDAYTKEDVESAIPVSTIEPNLVETYEPTPVMLIDTGNNVVEVNTMELDDSCELDGDRYGEANEQEAQIDVYHVDGQLQHIVMEGGTYIELQSLDDASKPTPTATAQSPWGSNRVNVSHSKSGSQTAVKKRPHQANPPLATSSAHANAKKHMPTNCQPRTGPMGVTPPARMLNAEQGPRRTSQVVRTKTQPNETASRTSNTLYRCPACSNLFVELTNYYNHSCPRASFAGSVTGQSSQKTGGGSTVIITNDGQRHQCSHCDMSYRTKLQYQKHEYEVHRISNENFGIKCNICHKLFSQRQDYELHVRAIHPKPGVSFVKIH